MDLYLLPNLDQIIDQTSFGLVFSLILLWFTAVLRLAFTCFAKSVTCSWTHFGFVFSFVC